MKNVSIARRFVLSIVLSLALAGAAQAQKIYDVDPYLIP